MSDNKYICPITQEEIKEGVITYFGNLYEKSAIEEWLESNNTDPLVNMILPTTYLWSVNMNKENEIQRRIKSLRALSNNSYEKGTSIYTNASFVSNSVFERLDIVKKIIQIKPDILDDYHKEMIDLLKKGKYTGEFYYTQSNLPLNMIRGLEFCEIKDLVINKLGTKSG